MSVTCSSALHLGRPLGASERRRAERRVRPRHQRPRHSRWRGRRRLAWQSGRGPALPPPGRHPRARRPVLVVMTD